MAIPLDRKDVNKKFKEIQDKVDIIEENVRLLVRLFTKILKKSVK